jgi:acetyl-CoA carboxylase biotin carboxyl carrier protein
MILTDEDVEEIIRTLDSSYFNELHIKTGQFELYLRRSQSGWTQEMRTLLSPDVIGAASGGAPNAATEAGAGEEAEADEEGIVAVRAPMVGTFYRAPKPGAPPFVDVGSEVGEHTVVGIVETMKLMNSISAGVTGTIVEICTNDGQLVEARHVLMRVRQVGA